MFTNLPSIFKSSVSDRLKSPLLGAFFLSWLGWNWRIFYLTFFSAADNFVISKLEFIEQNYLDIWNCLWGPLLSTGIIVLLLPILQIGAFWVQENYKLLRDKLDMRISAKKWLSPEYKKLLKKQHQNEIEEFEKLISRKDNSILKLNQDKNELEDNIKSVQTELQNLLKEKESLLELENSIGSVENVSNNVISDIIPGSDQIEILQLDSQLLKKELDSIGKMQNLSRPSRKRKDLSDNPEYLLNIISEFNQIKSDGLFQILINHFRTNTVMETDFLSQESFDYYITRNLIKKLTNPEIKRNYQFVLSTKGEFFKAWYLNELRTQKNSMIQNN